MIYFLFCCSVEHRALPSCVSISSHFGRFARSGQPVVNPNNRQQLVIWNQKDQEVMQPTFVCYTIAPSEWSATTSHARARERSNRPAEEKIFTRCKFVLDWLQGEKLCSDHNWHSTSTNPKSKEQTRNTPFRQKVALLSNSWSSLFSSIQYCTGVILRNQIINPVRPLFDCIASCSIVTVTS